MERPEKPSVDVLIKGDISPFELQILERTLERSYNLSPIQQDPEIGNVATFITMRFQLSLSQGFFRDISWRDLKSLLRDIAHRRGRNGAGFQLEFSTKDLELSFYCESENEAVIYGALDGFQHMLGIVNLMTDRRRLPPDVAKVRYSYDAQELRWRISEAGGTSNNLYRYSEETNDWIKLSPEHSAPD